ncbi:MAG: hypothetical protein K6E13_12170 [Lachnospiraceae bacterium]|nr:hypothetical protein [Lachnospiraceae bacterium]
MHEDVKTTIYSVDDVLEKYSEEESFEIDDLFVEIDEDSVLVATGPEIQIPELELACREGYMLTRYEDGEMVPDWSLSVFYNMDDTAENYVYYEQDGILVSLHNFLMFTKNISLSDFECIVKFDI